MVILQAVRSFAQPPDLEKIKNGEIYRSGIEGIKRTFFSGHRDSVLIFANELYTLAQENNNYFVKSFALQMTGEVYRGMSDLPSSLNKQFEALRLNKIEKDRIGEAYTRSFIGFTLIQLNEYRQAIDNMLPFVQDLEKSGDLVQVSFMYSNLCEAFTESGQLDSAARFHKQSEIFYDKADDNIVWNNTRMKALHTLIFRRYASLLTAMGNTDSAISTYRQVIDISNNYGITLNKITSLAHLARIYAGAHETDSSIKYARLFFAESGGIAQVLDEIIVLKILKQFHQDSFRTDSALIYANRLIQAQEQIYGEEKLRRMQLVMLNEQQSRIDDELRRVNERDRQRGLALGVILLMIIGFITYLIRNIRQKKRTNKQIEENRLSLEQALKELKSAQAQSDPGGKNGKPW